MLGMLTMLAVILILAVTGLSRAYRAQQQGLGARWYNRGLADLSAKHFDAAVTDFRAALLYSRDDFAYQLNLAEALIGQGHWAQAYAYLVNLWDREPDNGVVNLELARIKAQRGENDDAIRYYNNAVYAVWPRDQEGRRRDARLELIELLLRTHATAQAQGQLIALAERVGQDPAQQEHIGELFLRADDSEHALASFTTSLKTDRHNAEALAGAGRAAFELGRYRLAERYLEAAIAANPNDTASAEHLKTAQLVLRMDPFQRQVSAARRNRIVVDAFTTAGERLKTCSMPPVNSADAGPKASLSDEWARLKPQVTEHGLRRNPDLVDIAMDLVFRIERETSIVCGTPTGTDLALLMISKLHEEVR